MRRVIWKLKEVVNIEVTVILARVHGVSRDIVSVIVEKLANS